jgi:hypothetical protein
MMARPANFAAAKGTQYNLAMKERAEKVLLPDIFNAAQAYEDHVAMWGLEDGQVNQDPEAKKGTQIAWFPPSKPDRMTSKLSKGKRPRCDDDAEVAEGRDIDLDTQEDTDDDEKSAPSVASQTLSHQGPVYSYTSGQGKTQACSEHDQNSSHVPQQAPVEQSAGFSQTPAMSTSYHGLPLQATSFPTTSSFVDSMDVLSIGSSFGTCNNTDTTVGAAFDMQQPPGNTPQNASTIYPPSVWTEDRFAGMAPRSYPQSGALTTTQRLTQPYPGSSAFPIQDPSPAYFSDTSAYHVTNMDEKPSQYQMQYSPHMMEDSTMMLGATHSSVGTMPQDVDMASPERTRFPYIPDGHNQHPVLPY